MSVLGPGTPVPEFHLEREDGAAFNQEDLVGRTTVLIFYPFAFSPVCSEQLTLYEEVLDDFAERGADLVAISCDARYSQTAFREKLGVSIPQLSDFEPKGAVSAAFGVLHAGGFPERALVIVGPDGVVKWSYQADVPSDLPGANLIFDGLSG
ncbi:MAG TPA: redoxin domain-containing protein [Solirubrobacteraceae bacterium]|nr:redoxin domain-containing protein [Solirubrobacteraceae bacterium]